MYEPTSKQPPIGITNSVEQDASGIDFDAVYEILFKAYVRTFAKKPPMRILQKES